MSLVMSPGHLAPRGMRAAAGPLTDPTMIAFQSNEQVKPHVAMMLAARMRRALESRAKQMGYPKIPGDMCYLAICAILEGEPGEKICWRGLHAQAWEFNAVLGLDPWIARRKNAGLN